MPTGRAAGSGAGEPAAAAARRRQLRPTDVKRLNRAWRRRTEGPAGAAARLGQPAVQRRVDLPHRRRVRRRADLAVRQHAPARPPLGPQDRAGHRPACQLGARPDRGRGGRRRPPPAACRWSPSNWPAVPLPLHEAPLDGDVCLALGNEDHGCSPALLAAASAVAYIPQTGRVGSLNVAAAAAIALAEARRREMAARRRVAAEADARVGQRAQGRGAVFRRAMRRERKVSGRGQPPRSGRQRLSSGPSERLASAGILRAVRSWTHPGRWRSPTGAARRTSRRTPGGPSSTRSAWATATWRPTPGPPPTGCCWPSTTRPSTGSPAARAGSPSCPTGPSPPP